MTVAQIQSGGVNGTGTLTGTHGPGVGVTPDAILVLCFGLASSDEFNVCTYDGINIPEISISPTVLTTGEGGNVSVFFLAGGAWGSGNRTFSVTVIGANNKRCQVYSLSCALGKTLNIVDALAVTSTSITNPSASLSFSLRTAKSYVGFTSGQDAVGGIAPFAGWFTDNETDFGSKTGGSYSRLGANTDANSCTPGVTQTAEDFCGIFVAVAENDAFLPLIASTSTLYAPTVLAIQSVDLPFISSGETLYAPTIAQNIINLSFIPSGAMVYSPSVALGIYVITLDIGTVKRDGGATITMNGPLIPDGTYLVHVGPLGTETDPLCYSGVAGRADKVTFTGGIGSMVVPVLPVGGPYLFVLRRLTGPADAVKSTNAVLTVVPTDFRSATFHLRRYLPTWMRTGNRTLEQMEFPQ